MFRFKYSIHILNLIYTNLKFHQIRNAWVLKMFPLHTTVRTQNRCSCLGLKRFLWVESNNIQSGVDFVLILPFIHVMYYLTLRRNWESHFGTVSLNSIRSEMNLFVYLSFLHSCIFACVCVCVFILLLCFSRAFVVLIINKHLLLNSGLSIREQSVWKKINTNQFSIVMNERRALSYCYRKWRYTECRL